MPSITIEVTDAEYQSLEYAAVSPQEWTDVAVKNRARIAGDEIISQLIQYCNDNSIAIATGRDAQIAQAYELNVVKTVVQQNEEAQAAMSEV